AVCRGTTESAGNHGPAKTRKGNRWLRGVLIQAALAGGTRATKGALAARHRRPIARLSPQKERARGGAVAVRYRRRMQHRVHKKAVVAVAHAMLVAAYHLLARKTTYHDPGADYYE